MRTTARPPAEPAGYPSWLSRDVALLDGRSVLVRADLPPDITEPRRCRNRPPQQSPTWAQPRSPFP